MEYAFEETTFSLSQEAPRPPERRQNARHLTTLRVGVLIVGGRRELCLIRNISAGGLMAHVYAELPRGQRIAVELKTNHQVEGTVAWIEESNIGIRFDQPIEIEEMLATQATLGNGWRPRLPRVEVDRLATLRVGARTYGANTIDVSQGGVKLALDGAVDTGAEVVVTFDKFRPLHGVVRWSTAERAGISFNQVIPFKELMGWLRSV